MFGQNQQQQNQMALMNQQMHNQMQLNQQGQQIQQQNWDYTNYENQVKHMENAGLNVGLMYGMGGGGGQSMGAGGGGGASGGNAPQNNAPQMMAQMLQSEALKSQIALNEANANDANASADLKRGPQTENVGADTALKNMNTANAKIQNEIGNKTIEEVVDTIIANRDKAVAESSSAMTKASVDATTKQSTINQIDSAALNEALKGAVMKSGINLNDAQINKMAEEIKIGKFNAQTNADFQGLDKVAGGQLTKIINWFNGATNTKPDYQREIK